MGLAFMLLELDAHVKTSENMRTIVESTHHYGDKTYGVLITVPQKPPMLPEIKLLRSVCWAVYVAKKNGLDIEHD
jgi:hypothetical protein